MRIGGYADRWSVAPGEEIRFMVTSERSWYRADIVRLIHGDDNPSGPGVKEEQVHTSVDGEYRGRVQPLRHGSYVVIPDDERLRGARGFTLAAWILPTTPAQGAQAILAKRSADGRGYALAIEGGELVLRLGGTGAERVLHSGAELRASYWYFVAAVYDADRGTALVMQCPQPLWPLERTAATREEQVEQGAVADHDGPFTMAACAGGDGAMAAHFNGRIEAPVVLAEVLTPKALGTLAKGASAAALGRIAAAWDFSLEIPTSRVVEVSGNGLHGAAVNMPARGMTGHAFRGDELAWTRDATHHGAIHFHDDDLEDCGWDPDFALTVPDTMRSGAYAAKLTSGEDEAYASFFVRPPGRRASAPTLFLAPTNSYLAYVNFHHPSQVEDRILGLYHHHGDDTPVLYSSRLRPVANFAPKVDFGALGSGAGAPHQFNADLHLVDWLETKRFAYDVATDEDLEREGAALFAQYRVAISGTHPEYWSGAMLDALEQYLQSGGRFMYLGGNGLIQVTSFDPARPHVVEVRRAPYPVRAPGPGERHHSTTGEYGGPWRERNRHPQRLVGVGSIAQGFDRSIAYRRQPASFDPRASWIFDGIGDDEPIGDGGLVMGGAAGFEVDSADESKGTPPHALVVATATGFPESYEFQYPQRIPGTQVGLMPQMRCDMVFFETPNGGAVFSTGSIAYCGALSHNGYVNAASRVTENVLRRFSSEAPVNDGAGGAR